MRGINPWFIALSFGLVCTVGFVAIPCWLASVLFRGGALFQLAGLAFVTSHNRQASRGRVLWRNLLVWLPASFALFVPLRLEGSISQPGTIAGLLTGLALLALVSTVVARRGLADRLAGTFVVPK